MEGLAVLTVGINVGLMLGVGRVVMVGIITWVGTKVAEGVAVKER